MVMIYGKFGVILVNYLSFSSMAGLGRTSAAFGKCSAFSEANQEIGDTMELWEAEVPWQQGQEMGRGQESSSRKGQSSSSHLRSTHG